ncbi:hypothetical protein E2C01_094075 [Portunus trituberculatus]|uniref:Uncharacterized protein n=1 Tax=Portunus trituberculatus TaxID=210409 RepID=A0A5B7JVZ0_PORTR|nr:hypothetical protein [Portunus trituberculatus]
MGVTSSLEYLGHTFRGHTTPGDESLRNLQRLMKVTHRVIRKPRVTMTREDQVADGWVSGGIRAERQVRGMKGEQ